MRHFTRPRPATGPTASRTTSSRRRTRVGVVASVAVAVALAVGVAAPVSATGPLDAPVAEAQPVVEVSAEAHPVVGVAVRTADGSLDVSALPMPDAATAEAFAEAVAQLPSVAAADTASTVTASNDPLRSQQWALDRWTYTQATAVSSPAARAAVVVAVADTGVQASHPDFAPGTVVPGKSFVAAQSPDGRIDGHGHGTHVAGTIAASTGNGVGIAAAAAGVKILPVKVLTDAGSGSDYGVAQGVVWAVDNGAEVVNLSLGGTGTSTVMSSAVQYAQQRGVTVVAAAGNSAAQGSPVSYPAAYPSVIAVGSVDRFNRRSSFSNIGSYVDVAAPGSAIVAPVQTGGYATWSGTSMATPHVAAVAALARAAAPTATADQVRAAIESTAFDVGPVGSDAEFGAGIVRPLDAVQQLVAAAGPTPPAGPAPSTPTPEPTPSESSAWAIADFDGAGTTGTRRSSGDVADAAVTVEFGGAPHVFYADRTSGTLRHAWLSGATWNFEDLDGTGRLAAADGSQATVVAATVFAGAPHVFHRDASTQRLRHGWWTGRAWAFEDLDGPGVPGGVGRSANPVGGDVSVELFGGVPHVFHTDATTGDLRHGWWTGRVWAFETLDGAGGPAGRVDSEIAPDVEAHVWGGTVHTYHRDATTGRLRHGWWDVRGATWRFEDLDGPGTGGAAGRVDAPAGTDVTVVTYGTAPHVFYRADASVGSVLRHAWWTGSGWRFESLVTTSPCTECMAGSGITTAATGTQLHVWHHDGDAGRLRHTWWTGAQWSDVALDGDGVDGGQGRRSAPLGRYPAALQSQGRTYVFYADPSTGRMRLAVSTATA